jgi:hypothetical protein
MRDIQDKLQELRYTRYIVAYVGLSPRGLASKYFTRETLVRFAEFYEGNTHLHARDGLMEWDMTSREDFDSFPVKAQQALRVRMARARGMVFRRAIQTIDVYNKGAMAIDPSKKRTSIHRGDLKFLFNTKLSLYYYSLPIDLNVMDSQPRFPPVRHFARECVDAALVRN